MKILVTGSAGFIGSYLVSELLDHGHEVVGLDNFSKYGEVCQDAGQSERFRFVEGDARDADLLKSLADDADQIVAGAALIGGIGYFHEFAYDLLAQNEQISAATFDAAIESHRNGALSRIVVISSSMVYESATEFPTPEGHQRECPPPTSTYGFQKLAVEYFAQGAWEQYQLPHTIVRPFNCVGIGERRVTNLEQASGNLKRATSHVLPDLVEKVLRGEDPLHILGDGSQIRHYTYGGDLARGIRLAMESADAINQDFNLSTSVSTTVRELAELVWTRINGDRPINIVSDEPFQYDVQKRIPDTRKAAEILGFEATTDLDAVLDEVIPWIREQMELGNL